MNETLPLEQWCSKQTKGAAMYIRKNGLCVAIKSRGYLAHVMQEQDAIQKRIKRTYSLDIGDYFLDLTNPKEKAAFDNGSWYIKAFIVSDNGNPDFFKRNDIVRDEQLEMFDRSREMLRQAQPVGVVAVKAA
jgi:hypothetical protein